MGGAVAAASLGINLLALALPLALLQVFDRVLPNQSDSTLMVLFGALLVAAALDFALRLARLGLLGDTGERYELRLTDAVTARMLDADPAAFEAVTGGAHLDRINAIAQLRDHYGGQGRLLALDIPFAAVFVGLIGLIGGPLALAPLGCICALALASAGLRRLQAPALAGRESVDRRRYSFLMESLGQIETMKAHAMEPRMMRRYELLQSQAERASRRLIWASGMTQAVSAVLSQVGIAAMAATGGLLAVQGRLGIAEIAACMLLNGRAMQPMSRVVGLWVQRAHLQAAEARLKEVESLAPDAALMASERPGAMFGRVSVEGVRLGMGGEAGARNVSFIARPGGCVALTGASGDEGSTLLRMVAGEVAPGAGAVRIDGQPAQRFAHMRGRRGVVLVDGRAALFEGTLLDNLSMFGDAEARDAGMEAARRIGLGEQIDRLPLGFDTPALIRGRLAGTLGFAQRIAIARAIACDPRILLFDEANTALDLVADRQLMAALEALRGRTTLILSTRRPSYLALADEVIDLSGHDLDATPAEASAAPSPAAPSAEAERWSDDLAEERGQAASGARAAVGASGEVSGPEPAPPPAGRPGRPASVRSAVPKIAAPPEIRSAASRRAAAGAASPSIRPEARRPSKSVAASAWMAGGLQASPSAHGDSAPAARPAGARLGEPGDPPRQAVGPERARNRPILSASPQPAEPDMFNVFREPPAGAAKAVSRAELDAWTRDLAEELAATLAPRRGGERWGDAAEHAS
ncbi:ATP-binding cassette, subfamily C, LapB [Albimonas donghaensis]|uniref:ATP-binding cassette, subfamily C, LapB n=2 Tax=Albimonas donghaensis TaxID=356660 RepID=A0A1H3EPV9_9RHOB|nr:ATP-binding cassette, subfamily C, LapB [Albimonas donghaensis]